MEPNLIQRTMWRAGASHRFWKDAQVALFTGEFPKPLAVQKAQRMSRTPETRLGTPAKPAQLVVIHKNDQVEIEKGHGEWVIFHRQGGEPQSLLLDKNTFVACSRPRIVHFDWSVYEDRLIITPTFCCLNVGAFYSYDADPRKSAPVYGQGCVFLKPGIVHLKVEDQPWVAGRAHCCARLANIVLDWDGDSLTAHEDEEVVLWRRDEQPPEMSTVH